jgi:hypothetical protein
VAGPANLMAAWQSYYVIIGSSAAALIGLQFVVITLIADTRSGTTAGTVSAFGTPTVVHLGGALLVSAIMNAPWPSLGASSVALAICGFAGIGYGAVVLSHARRQRDYRPVWEDWLWYAILPGSAYLALTLAALFLRAAAQPALFVVGGVALGLLLIGIHNAWDAVTYHVLSRSRANPTKTTGARRPGFPEWPHRACIHRAQGSGSTPVMVPQKEARCRSADSETVASRSRRSGSAAWG